MQTITLSLFRFPRWADRHWVLWQMLLARRDFAAMDGVTFWKLCGSGTGEGFRPRPNPAVWAILAAFPDVATAAARTRAAPVYARWSAHSDAAWTLYLHPLAARGAWAGRTPFAPAAMPEPAPDAPRQPLAVLTRATIRRRGLRGFWRRAPGVSAAIGRNPDVMFKIGIGEVPWLHQVTFSIWPDAASMSRFAHQGGPHPAAIRAVRANGWFREELYARFRVAGADGAWPGAPALDPPALDPPRLRSSGGPDRRSSGGPDRRAAGAAIARAAHPAPAAAERSAQGPATRP